MQRTIARRLRQLPGTRVGDGPLVKCWRGRHTVDVRAMRPQCLVAFLSWPFSGAAGLRAKCLGLAPNVWGSRQMSEARAKCLGLASTTEWCNHMSLLSSNMGDLLGVGCRSPQVGDICAGTKPIKNQTWISLPSLQCESNINAMRPVSPMLRPDESDLHWPLMIASLTDTKGHTPN